MEDPRDAQEGRGGADPGHATAGATPERIGPYRILDTLGEGGMGIVFVAEQREPVHRRVAVKLIKPGMDTREVLARFEAERQALAMMGHPNIAKVHDAGMTDSGRPYFAMEYVAGTPITEYCDRERLTTIERIELLLDVCAGMQHAHQKGIIHRDLKPSNVLVTALDGVPVPKIIDFGVAKATNQRLTERTLFTEMGVLVGTPEYMSPEQAEPTVLDVDTRTDVYSLGVMLYELLVGDLPFEPTRLRQAGLLELQRVIREEVPPKPSTALDAQGERSTDTGRRRRADPRALLRSLRGDLDWVVMTAMEKERERRYESVGAFAADLRRHLAYEPVSAGPPSQLYRLKKYIRRHRAGVLAGALVTLALVAGLFASLWFYFDAEDARELEVRARKKESTARRLADAKATEALARKSEFDMLANVVRLEDAKAEERLLYPAWPEHIAAMRDWLRRWGDRLEGALPELRQTVGDLAARTRPSTPAGRQTEEPARELLLAFESQRFLHDTLADVTGRIEAFLAVERESVQQRLAWAERVETLTSGHPGARVTWDQARMAILRADGETASARYRDQPLDLPPQTGLVPMGMNPATKLWEFYHLRSAWDPASGIAAAEGLAIPQHAADGALQVDDHTGIVFVLVPGGTFSMGATDDPRAKSDETAHDVTLAPFFLARHELTQGQWLRLTGESPSLYRPGQLAVTLAHPVEQVDWNTAVECLQRFGLELPTEAQWEYGCRGGTPTPWFCGSDVADLQGYANVMDQRAKQVTTWTQEPVAWNDGHVIHAPVATYPANDFGLHDVHGNIYEWCRDLYGGYGLEVRSGDGLRQVPTESATNRVARGGSFLNPARSSRSSNRNNFAPVTRNNALGLRAARAVLR